MSGGFLPFNEAKWIWVEKESKSDTYGDFTMSLFGKRVKLTVFFLVMATIRCILMVSM